MKKFGTVILGSGHFSVGYAATAKDTLIVERTYLTDPEMSATLSGYRTSACDSLEGEAEALYSVYKNSEIASGDALDSPLLEIGLSAYAKSRGIRFLFGTECTNVTERDGGYEVTLFGNAGYETVIADKVIDRRKPYGGTLNVLFKGDTEAISSMRSEIADLTVSPSFREGESIVGYTPRVPMNINAAKSAILYELSESLPEEVRVVQVAYLFCDGSERDALAEFIEGIKAAKEVRS